MEMQQTWERATMTMDAEGEGTMILSLQSLVKPGGEMLEGENLGEGEATVFI